MSHRFREVAYEPARDLPRLVEFATRTVGRDGPARGCMHLGDVLWGDFLAGLPGATSSVRLWEDEAGALAGYAWVWGADDASFFLRPDLKRGPERWSLTALMLTWREERSAAIAPSTPVRCSELASDHAFATWMSERGFRLTDLAPLIIFRRGLAAAPEPAPLPDGWCVRPLRGPEEYAARAAIHAEVWHPSRVTADAYARLRDVAGFDPELDLVAVGPDGVFGAYATLWHDPVNRTAEFEPVGAREAFRGRGLAKAVLTEALRRAHGLGVDTVFVYTGEDRVPARRLYESVGFSEIDRWVYFTNERESIDRA